MLQALNPMQWLAVLLGLFPLAQQATVPAPPPPPNEVSAVAPNEPSQPFDEWLDALIQEARDRGFSKEVIDATLHGLEPLPRVIQRDRSQAELRPGFNRYSSSHLTRAMVTRGRDLARENAAILDRVETDYEVQRRYQQAPGSKRGCPYWGRRRPIAAPRSTSGKGRRS